MLEVLFRLLRSVGFIKDESAAAENQDDRQSLVVVVSDELIELFSRVALCTRTGDAAGRKNTLTEILLRFGDDIEITAVPSDRGAIRIRPRQARFSALTVVKLNELDQDVCRVALARMLKRPVQQATKSSSNLPQARLSP